MQHDDFIGQVDSRAVGQPRRAGGGGDDGHARDVGPTGSREGGERAGLARRRNPGHGSGKGALHAAEGLHSLLNAGSSGRMET